MSDDSPQTVVVQRRCPKPTLHLPQDIIRDKSRGDEDDDGVCSECSYTSDDISCLTDFSVPICDIEEPGVNDVILCKSNSYRHSPSSSSHPGNRRFRSLLDEYQRLYRNAPPSDKPFVAAGVVRIWRSLDRPGRFLTTDADGRWYDVGDRHAMYRTSRCLSADDATLSTVGGSVSWSSSSSSGGGHDDQVHEHYASLVAFQRERHNQRKECFFVVGNVLQRIFVSCFENHHKEGIWAMP